MFCGPERTSLGRALGAGIAFDACAMSQRAFVSAHFDVQRYLLHEDFHLTGRQDVAVIVQQAPNPPARFATRVHV